jgi:hypothetical protein
MSDRQIDPMYMGRFLAAYAIEFMRLNDEASIVISRINVCGLGGVGVGGQLLQTIDGTVTKRGWTVPVEFPLLGEEVAGPRLDPERSGRHLAGVIMKRLTANDGSGEPS